MFGLLRTIFSLLVLAITIWFATMVPLGSRTLWGHIKAISGTKEAQELAEGTKDEAKKVADKLLSDRDAGVRPHVVPGHSQRESAPPQQAMEEVDEDDHHKLDELTRPTHPGAQKKKR
jgi:hypothetical protein